MVKKLNIYILLGALSLTMVFSACGDSGSTDTPKGPDMSVAAMEDLPNCTENREGVTALVVEDNATYECKSGKWIFVSAPMQTAETLDDLSNCTSKAEGDTVMVVSESALFRCDDGKWEKYRSLTDTLVSAEDLLACVAKREGNTSYITKEHALYRCEDGSWEKTITFMDTVKTKDNLSNCTGKKEGDTTFVSKEESVYLCIDKEWAYLGEVTDNSDDLPNCTEKREGNRAFVTAEHEALICNEGKWLPYDIYQETEEKNSTESSGSSDESSSSQENESSSSKDSKSADVKYDCSLYKCVTTEYLNQEMLTAGRYGELLDFRNGRVYRTIKIGMQTWMAQDLDFSDGNSQKGKYGQLYQSCSKNTCPDGWHIPDTLEWHEMISYVSNNNGGEPIGISLKATSGWISEGDTIKVMGDGIGSVDSVRVGATTGMDRFGFGALPSGSCWGSECYTGDDARYWVKGGSFYKLAFDKDELFVDDARGAYVSIRCIQDEESLENISSSSVKESFSSSSQRSEKSSSSVIMTVSSSSALSSSSVVSSSFSEMTPKSSSSSFNQFNPDVEYGELEDTRDGRIYRTVAIDSMTWMAENLNYASPASQCYGNDTANCSIYGRLYLQSDALEICPEGWRLPTSDEARRLLSKGAPALLAGDDNSTGFSALLGGSSNGNMGSYAIIWSLMSNYDIRISRSSVDFLRAASGELASVRCLKGEDLGQTGKSSSSEAPQSSSSQKNTSSSSEIPQSSSSEKSSSSSEVRYGTLKDSRDGQIYKTVVIDTLTWMAENLNYGVDSSFCYNNEDSNCAKYGRLYRWAAAVGKLESECGYGYTCSLPSGYIQGVCPNGWHLPSKTEWEALFNAVGGQSTVGKVLKSTSGWYSSGDGLDAFGFSAFPAGFRDTSGYYLDEGYSASFWSSTEISSYNAYYVDFGYYGNDAYLNDFFGKIYGFSVRCLRD